MATESNGSGRLDKLEAIRAKVGERMDQMAERQATGYWQHEQRHLEHEESIARIDTNFERLQAHQEHLDQRVGDLVTAIGALIASRQPK